MVIFGGGRKASSLYRHYFALLGASLSVWVGLGSARRVLGDICETSILAKLADAWLVELPGVMVSKDLLVGRTAIAAPLGKGWVASNSFCFASGSRAW